MTNAQERAKELEKTFRGRYYPGMSPHKQNGLIEILTASLAQVEAETWEAAKAKNADQHTLAQRLWDEAKKNCWGKP